LLLMAPPFATFFSIAYQTSSATLLSQRLMILEWITLYVHAFCS
jgi:hypothetical protein